MPMSLEQRRAVCSEVADLARRIGEESPRAWAARSDGEGADHSLVIARNFLLAIVAGEAHGKATRTAQETAPAVGNGQTKGAGRGALKAKPNG